MFASIIIWGSLAGLVHFVLVGALYGNPFVDRIYAAAQAGEPGVRAWSSKPRYLLTQFLGTQVEVFVLTAGYFGLRGWLATGRESLGAALLIGLLFAGLRVYPRFWNMWIQSTYPGRLLAIEVVNGTLGTFAVVLLLHFAA